jgi:hypothetical protein
MLVKMLHSTAILALLSIANLPAAAIAKDQQDCLTAEQLGNVSVALLPGMVTRLSAFCATSLPANASLSVSGANSAAQHADAIAAARPSAFETIKLIAGDDFNLPSTMTADALFPFVEAMAAGEMEKMNKEEVCPVANNVWSAIKDVPMDKWGMLVATLVGSDKGSKKAVEDDSDKESSKKRGSFEDKIRPCPFIATEELPVENAK